jgi:hypothetical protein
MKPHSSVRVVRLGSGECTNPVLRCFINPQVMNYGDLLVGVVHKFTELAICLRLSTEVLSQNLSGAWVTILG